MIIILKPQLKSCYKEGMEEIESKSDQMSLPDWARVQLSKPVVTRPSALHQNSPNLADRAKVRQKLPNFLLALALGRATLLEL